MTTPAKRDIDVAMIEIAANRMAARAQWARSRREKALGWIRLVALLVGVAVCAGLGVLVILAVSKVLAG